MRKPKHQPGWYIFKVVDDDQERPVEGFVEATDTEDAHYKAGQAWQAVHGFTNYPIESSVKYRGTVHPDLAS